MLLVTLTQIADERMNVVWLFEAFPGCRSNEMPTRHCSLARIQLEAKEREKVVEASGDMHDHVQVFKDSRMQVAVQVSPMLEREGLDIG